MGRRDYKNARRPQADGPAAKPRKGGGLGTGLFIGLILGMVIAGGLYWYLNTQPSGLKSAEPAPGAIQPKALPPPEIETPSAPAPAAPDPVRDLRAHPEPTAGRPPEPPANGQAKPAPKTDYSFYDILPGNARPHPKPLPHPPAQPVKPKGADKAGETLWLQVAALRAAADAERLKARLSLLALPVAVQRIDSGDAALYRVRVGPFKSENDGLDALDTLSENNFEPRWVKDPVNP